MNNIETQKFKIATYLRFAGNALFYPFFALFLSNKGIIEDKMSFILSISPFLGIITNPIYALICKNFNTTKTIASIISIIEGIFIFIVSFSSNVQYITIFTIMIGIFGAAHFGLLDSLTTLYAKVKNVDYSSIRVFGSIGFVVSLLLGGFIIKYSNYSYCFALSLILYTINGIIYLLIKPIDNDVQSKEEESVLKTYGELFKNKRYMTYIIFYMFTVGLIFATDGFFSTFLKQTKGIDEMQFGFINGFFVFCEALTLFILSKRKKHVHTGYMLLSAAIMYSVRMFVNFLEPNIYIIILASVLRGVGYAFLVYTSCMYVIHLVGKKNSTKGVMLMFLFQGILTTVSSNIFGKIIANTSYKTYYLVNTLLGLVVIVYWIFRLKFVKKKKVSQDNV